ncbi:MAG: DNA ligase [Nitrospiraceae bacterium]|nr:DNA ligase [Nitrospiraceae bacterium]
MKFLTLIQYFERLEATTKRLDMFEILAELFRLSNANEIDKIIYLVQEQLLPSFYTLEMGMSEKLLIRAITDASGKDLTEIQQHFRSSGDLGITTEHFLSGQHGTNLDVHTVYSQLCDLAELAGKGSVEQKVEALTALLHSATPTEAKYISRFVVGRMRLGTGNATILEALSLAKTGERKPKTILERGFNLCSDLGMVGRILFTDGISGIEKISPTVGSPIRMALCERVATPEDVIKKIGRCSVEPKLDGFRCQIHKSKEEVEIFSRNLERTTPMFPELVQATKTAINAESIIFEGEALSYDDLTGELQPFQVTIQRKRKHGIVQAATDIPLKLFAFDLLYVNGEDWTNRAYSDRRKLLSSLITNNPVIELGHADETDDPAEFSRIFQTAIDKGAEGVVAKRLDGPYKAGARDFNWIKLKRSYKGTLADTVDVCLVGYFSGKGTRAEFGIGAVLATVYDPNTDTFKTVSRIGSGFSQEDWGRLRKVLDSHASESMPPRVVSTLTPNVWVHPHTVITVMADEITRSAMHTCGKDENGIGYALRFPRAQGFIRSDKNPEDATTVSEIITMSESQKLIKLA